MDVFHSLLVLGTGNGEAEVVLAKRSHGHSLDDVLVDGGGDLDLLDLGLGISDMRSLNRQCTINA